VETWRFLDLEYLDPYLNMAVDEAILLTVDNGRAPNTLRLWRNLNAVVLGQSLSVGLEVNFKAAINYGTAIVRRFTGGGAVYNDLGNLNWTVVTSKSCLPLSEGMPDVFRTVSEPIIEGLRLLGINTTFHMPNSIQFNRKKVSGMAARVKRNSILCHGTLLVDTNLEILREVLDVPDQTEVKGVPRSVHAEIANLQQYSHLKDISLREVKNSVIEGFEKRFKVKLEKGKLNSEEEVLAQGLVKSKYSLIEWNFRH
jgi:lipoate-protein ligase A